MKKLDFYDKKMQFENYRYQMYCLLKEKPMSIPELLEFVPLTRSAAQNMIDIFVIDGNLTFFKGKNPKTGKELRIYKYNGIEYTKKTREYFINLYQKQKFYESKLKEPKRPSWYNPHATVYNLLDKKREPAPRPKGPNLYGNICSSFSMMEIA